MPYVTAQHGKGAKTADGNGAAVPNGLASAFSQESVALYCTQKSWLRLQPRHNLTTKHTKRERTHTAETPETGGCIIDTGQNDRIPGGGERRNTLRRWARAGSAARTAQW